MKPEDILDAIGNADEACVKKAKEPKSSRKMVWITLGSLAACILVVLMLPGVLSPLFIGPDKQAEDESTGELKTEWDDVWIHYVTDSGGDQDGAGIVEIAREQVYLPLDPEEIFEVWKEKNAIGADVQLIRVKIVGDGDACCVDGIVEHEPGDRLIYNITVTQTLENYYDTVNADLLLESLKQTMTGYANVEYDEYHLTLE